MIAGNISDRFSGFSNCRLAVVACIQIMLLLAIGCSADTSQKGTAPGNEISVMRQRLSEMNFQEKALKEEFSIAQNFAPYLVIRPSDSAIELKTRGRNLRSFKIREISKWETGTNEDVIWTVTGMKPIQRSDRPRIKPGAGSDAHRLRPCMQRRKCSGNSGFPFRTSQFWHCQID